MERQYPHADFNLPPYPDFYRKLTNVDIMERIGKLSGAEQRAWIGEFENILEDPGDVDETDEQTEIRVHNLELVKDMNRYLISKMGRKPKGGRRRTRRGGSRRRKGSRRRGGSRRRKCSRRRR